MAAPEGLVRRLYDITRGGGRAKAVSMTPPADLAEAMTVQAELCALLGRDVRGEGLEGRAYPGRSGSGAVISRRDSGGGGIRADSSRSIWPTGWPGNRPGATGRGRAR